MTTNSTTRRKAPTKAATGQDVADRTDELLADAQAAIAESRELTGMQEVYDAIDEAVGVPNLKAKMLRRRLDAHPVEVAGLGTIMLRGLAQAEVKQAKAEAAAAKEADASVDQDALFEHLLVSRALVEPQLTPEEVAVWFANAPAGESLEAMSAVQRLSGMDRGSTKSGLPAV